MSMNKYLKYTMTHYFNLNKSMKSNLKNKSIYIYKLSLLEQWFEQYKIKSNTDITFE